MFSSSQLWKIELKSFPVIICISIVLSCDSSQVLKYVERKLNRPTPWLTLLLVFGKSRVNQNCGISMKWRKLCVSEGIYALNLKQSAYSRQSIYKAFRLVYILSLEHKEKQQQSICLQSAFRVPIIINSVWFATRELIESSISF